MGLFRKLGKIVEAAVELTDDSSQGIGLRAESPPVALRPDASSLTVLHALAASSGGTRGRAIVQSTDGVSQQEWGVSARGSCTIQMLLRAREVDGGFGPRVEKHVLLPIEAALLIGSGLEIPITRDPVSGAFTGVDRSALIEELRPQFAQALADDEIRRRRGMRYAADAIREGFDELLVPAAAPDAIEGVTADQWLQARRVVGMGKIPPAIVDRTLAAYGVPAGRWPQVDAAWSQRAASDPALAARLAAL